MRNLRWLAVFPPTWVFCCVVTVEEMQLDIHSGFDEAGGADALFISCTVLRYQVRAMYFWSWPGCFCVLYRLAMLLKSTSGSLSRFLSILGSWEMSFTNGSHWRRAPYLSRVVVLCLLWAIGLWEFANLARFRCRCYLWITQNHQIGQSLMTCLQYTFQKSIKFLHFLWK